MVTENEMQKCKNQLEEIYGDMNEDELRDKMADVIDIMTNLYRRYYEKLFAGDEWGVDHVDRLLHLAHVQMATIAAMLEEAKKS